MSYSSLATEYIPSPCNWGKRSGPVSVITIHHMAVVNGDPVAVAKSFANPDRHASATYCIGSDGKIVCGLDESIAPGTSGPGIPGKNNDLKAVTMEIANSKGAPNWEISDRAMEAAINLCVDICQRNGIPKLTYTGDANGNLTMHCMFSATACPGPYLKSKMNYIADEVNKRLGGKQEQSTIGEPPKQETVKYKVKKGDTLSKIAAQYGTTVDQIVKDNKIKNPNFIKVGQELVINAPTEKKTEAPKKELTPEVKVTTARLNVRKGPSTKYHVVTVLDKGVKVTVYAVNGDWVKIDKNLEQWCNKNWLK